MHRNLLISRVIFFLSKSSGGFWYQEFTKDAKSFYTTQSNGQIALWDVRNAKKPQKNVNAGFQKVFEASLSPDEKYLTSVGVNYAIDIYEAKSLKKIKSIPCNLFK